MKPRICFVIPSLGVGGTERQLLYLIKGLRDTFEIMVICTHSDGAWVDDVRRMGRVKVMGLRGGWDPRLKSGLKKYFRAYKPSVVHSFMFGFDYAVNVAARDIGIPVVVSSRRQCADWKKPRHIRLQKKGNLLVDAIIANSAVVAEYAAAQEDLPISDYTVILNGIDSELFQSSLDPKEIKNRYRIPEGKIIVGIVANFSPVKDHLLFVEIARELTKRRDDIHFVMAGKGPELGPIGAKLREYGLEEHVTQLDTNSGMQDMYRMMDVAVLTSKNEGFPNVVMEAMASGTPVVAANVGGVPELIRSGETGILIDGRDPQAFADAIERCLDDPEASVAMADAALAHVREHLSVDSMVSNYRELYLRLLNEAATEGKD